MYFNVRILPIPASIILVSSLSFSSQYLFYSLDPGPLTSGQSWLMNINTALVFICYARAILTDAGRLVGKVKEAYGDKKYLSLSEGESRVLAKQRWCRICEQPKPPRSHHCRVCKSCVAKMDHHCPWTVNCVGYRSFPHFFRFVFYSVTSLVMMEYFLWIRSADLWNKRHVHMV
jgi:palmitoyltransferase